MQVNGRARGRAGSLEERRTDTAHTGLGKSRIYAYLFHFKLDYFTGVSNRLIISTKLLDTKNMINGYFLHSLLKVGANLNLVDN